MLLIVTFEKDSASLYERFRLREATSDTPRCYASYLYKKIVIRNISQTD